MTDGPTTGGPPRADRPTEPPVEPADASPDPATALPVPAPVPPPVPPAPLTPPDYDERGVPSLDYVRDKIEGRYATSVGAAELAEGTAAGRTVEQQEAERAEKAKAKLDEIRRSLGR